MIYPNGLKKIREGSDSSPCLPPICDIVFRQYSQSQSVHSLLSDTSWKTPFGAILSWEWTGQMEEKVKDKDGEKYRIQRLLPTLKSEVTMSPSNA